MFANQEETQRLRVDLKRPRTEFSLQEPASSASTDEVYRIESNWWHLSRREPSIASASLFVGAPVTIASLISPWLARAFLPFTFAALWIGAIETLIHFARYVRKNGLDGLGWSILALVASITGHALMLLISFLRGLNAETPALMCALFSTGAYVLGIGIMLIAEEWWYAITPSQMLFLMATLHAMGLLLVIGL